MPSTGSAERPTGGPGGPSSVRSIYLPLLYLGLGAAAALVWQHTGALAGLRSWHHEMITGAAPAPNQYRPLTPWLAEILWRLMPGAGVTTAYFLLRAVVTGATLMVFHRYLRVWFSPVAAAAGTLCLAAIIPYTQQRVVQESDPINLLVFVAAFWAIAVRKDRLLLPLVLVGTLNREAAALIPAVYLVARWGELPAGRLATRTAALTAAWGIVYGGLLWGYGLREYYCPTVMFFVNVGSWKPTAYLVVLFGVMWVLAFRAGGDAPRFLRRALWLVIPYAALHYVLARVEEVRLFLPFAPVVIPLAWWTLFPEARRRET